MTRKVIEVIDGDTFRVSPKWKFKGRKGNVVRPTGYDTPEKGRRGYQEAKKKLKKLILGKKVELKNPIKITYNRLLCNVYINLANSFPEYKKTIKQNLKK